MNTSLNKTRRPTQFLSRLGLPTFHFPFSIFHFSFSFLLLFPSLAAAAAISWDGGGDGVSWSDAINWSGDVLPGASDDVTINVGGTATITLASGTQTINSLSCDEALVISGGSLDIAAASSITAGGSLTLSGGTLTGGGTLTVTSTMVWSSGTMSGSDSTIIQSGATLTLSAGTSTLDTRTLDNSGTITWTGGTFYLNNSAVLNNQSGALFDMQSNNTMSFSVGPAGSFTNSGTFRKSAGTGISSIDDAFDNTGGTIEGQSGTLSFTGGGTHTGSTYTVSSGATVTHSGVHFFSGSFSGTISGTLENTGTFTATGGGATFNFTGNGLTLPTSTL